MRNIVFEPQAFDEFTEWATIDKKVFARLGELIREIRRTPFEGRGKPEPLKHNYKGYWSRRITDEHRIVYRVDNDVITIIACKFHY